MQVKVPSQARVGDPNTFIFVTDNAESGRALGAEAEGGWAITEEFSIEASIAWLDTEIRRFNAETCPGGPPLPGAPPCFEGHPFPHAPPVSYALSGIYQRSESWFARLDLAGKGAFYFDYDESTGDDRKSDAYALVNLRAGREIGHWRAELWIRNLFDKEYAVRGFYFGNEPPAFVPTRYIRFGDPRQVGVSIAWKM
jgi:outer membrane receptor protein involved in Fe transport